MQISIRCAAASRRLFNLPVAREDFGTALSLNRQARMTQPIGRTTGCRFRKLCPMARGHRRIRTWSLHDCRLGRLHLLWGFRFHP